MIFPIVAQQIENERKGSDGHRVGQHRNAEVDHPSRKHENPFKNLVVLCPQAAKNSVIGKGRRGGVIQLSNIDNNNQALISRGAQELGIKFEEKSSPVHKKAVFTRKDSFLLEDSGMVNNTQFPILKEEMGNSQEEDHTQHRLKINTKFNRLTCRNGIHLEREIKQAPKKDSSEYLCIIRPESLITLVWGLVMIILLLFTAIYVPFRIAYLDEVDLTLYVIEWVVDGFFFIDIILNFFTAYYDDNNVLITDKLKIAKRYLKSWFLIDIIGCIPIHLFQDESTATYGKSARLLRLPRLSKLFKMFRLAKLLNIFQENWIIEQIMFKFEMHAGLIRLLKGLLFLFFFVHIFACAWFWWAKEWGYVPDSWVVRYGMRNEDPEYQYLVALYWVMQTTTTVGFGDIIAVTNGERSFALVLMIFGVGFYSYTVGNFTSLFTSEDSKNSKLKKKLHALNEFAHTSKLPQHLYFRIKRALKRNNETQYQFSSFDNGGILSELPASLRSEVITFTHKNIVDNISFFKDKDPNFIVDILPKFRHISMEKDEVLYAEGNYAEEGRIHLVNQEGYAFRTYIQGSYFGEIEILSKPEFRSSTAIAAMESEILAIRRVEFIDIISEYPEIKEELLKVVQIRQHFHKKAEIFAKKTNLKLIGITWNRIQSQTAVGSIYNIKSSEEELTPREGSSPNSPIRKKTTRNIKTVLDTGFESMVIDLEETSPGARTITSLKLPTIRPFSSSSSSSLSSCSEISLEGGEPGDKEPQPASWEEEKKGENVNNREKAGGPVARLNLHTPNTNLRLPITPKFIKLHSTEDINNESVIELNIPNTLGAQSKQILTKHDIDSSLQSSEESEPHHPTFSTSSPQRSALNKYQQKATTKRIEDNLLHIKKVLENSKQETKDFDILRGGALSNREHHSRKYLDYNNPLNPKQRHKDLLTRKFEEINANPYNPQHASPDYMKTTNSATMITNTDLIHQYFANSNKPGIIRLLKKTNKRINSDVDGEKKKFSSANKHWNL